MGVLTTCMSKLKTTLCLRERERRGERAKKRGCVCVYVFVCVGVLTTCMSTLGTRGGVRERESERERERERERVCVVRVLKPHVCPN